MLAVGMGAGLFEIDSDSLSYPVLRALDGATIDLDVDLDFSDEGSGHRDCKAKVVRDDDAEPPFTPSADWKPPRTLSCGHVNWESAESNAVAQAEGKCCANKGPYQWRLRGLTHAVPAGKRRSAEKVRSGGFPGLCCDMESGLYIGGLGNDCRHYHDGKNRCAVHQPIEF